MESTEDSRELVKTTVHELPIPHFELLKAMMLVGPAVCMVSSVVAILTLDTAPPPNLCTAPRRRFPGWGSSSAMGSNFDAQKR